MDQKNLDTKYKNEIPSSSSSSSSSFSFPVSNSSSTAAASCRSMTTPATALTSGPTTTTTTIITPTATACGIDRQTPERVDSKREQSSDRERDKLVENNVSPKKRNIDLAPHHRDRDRDRMSSRSSNSNSSSSSSLSFVTTPLKPLDQSKILSHSNSNSPHHHDRPRNTFGAPMKKSSCEFKDEDYDVREEKISINLLDLAWEDILFVYCLPRLSWEDLFHLRQLSTRSSRMVSQYFSQLKRLDLSAVRSTFTETAFKVVTENCSILRQVTLTNSCWIKDAALNQLFRSNKLITYVDLSGCRGLTGSCLLALCVSCKSMTSLHLRECMWVSRGALETLMSHLRRLQHVDFTSCAALSNQQIIPFVQFFPRLTRLHLAHIQGVNDATLIMIARNLRDILHLDIRSCMCVTDHGIRAIAEYCLKLRVLSINNCQLVTEYSLYLLRSRGNVTLDRPCVPFDMAMGLVPRVQV